MADRDEGHGPDAVTTSTIHNEKQPQQQQHTPPSTFPSILTSTLVFSLAVVGLAIFAPDAWRAVFTDALDGLNRTVRPPFSFGGGPELRLNVSSCPGYKLTSVRDTPLGLHAHLELAGPACNAYGVDVKGLKVEVAYESDTRLHVHIYDTTRSHFQIPSSVFSRPTPSASSHASLSPALKFHYNPSPFEFWITRGSDPNGEPIFDTRASGMPNGGKPVPPPRSLEYDEATAIDGTGLVFEERYVQLTSSLPLGANIYGLGEVLASSGFRRDVGSERGVANSGGGGSVQTNWARDISDPVDENVYGAHPFYLEHRYDPSTKKSTSHGVFLLNSAPSDIFLLTPPTPYATNSLLQYRLVGGTLDLYFLAGPSPVEVVQQYSDVVGKPAWVPYWAFGFHLCRWGYSDIAELKDQVAKMREAGVPLETMWSDIDLYHAYRDFTTDPVSYPAEEVREFLRELARNHQHYIPIVDAAIPKTVNNTDVYDPYARGVEQQVFVKNSNETEYIGQVWPGYTVFPDWFSPNTAQWWKEALQNWSTSGVEFSGIWLDMNEVSSFCDGSCGTDMDITNTSTPFALPSLTEHYPEGDPRDKREPAPSNREDTNAFKAYKELYERIKREVQEGKLKANKYNINTPPYTVHNGFGALGGKTLSPDTIHANGILEIDAHNLWGLIEEQATYSALLDILPGKRPFLISRSTFPSSGRWSGHWLGDNFSLWRYMHFSIQGVLQFQLFQIPMVGPDTCGFDGNANEELCNRWMQLSAFFPFYRNHNILGALPQEPYRWESVARASSAAMAVRYKMLPYWYSLFANASLNGLPPVRALFFEFPDEPELFSVDRQFMVGSDIMVTPVLVPGMKTVKGTFPGRGGVVWRDWYTHTGVKTRADASATLPAPLGHINVHIRSGSAMLLHSEPAYTTSETRASSYELLVSLSGDGSAFGWVYLDDGESLPPGPSTTLRIFASGKEGSVSTRPEGEFIIEQKLKRIVVLGMEKRPKTVELAGKTIEKKYLTFVGARKELIVDGLEADLNQAILLHWS